MRSGVLLSVAAMLAVAVPAQAADPPPLSAYAAGPAVFSVAMSPDGSRVAYVMRVGNKRVAQMMDSGGTVTPLLGDGQTEIGGLQWIDSQHILIYASGKVSGNETIPAQTLTQGLIYNLRTQKVYVVLDRTPDVAPVLPGGDVVRSGQTFQGKPSLFVKALRYGPKFGLYRVDLETGRGVFVDGDSLEATQWVTSQSGALVARTSYDPTSKLWTLEAPDGRGWRRVRREVMEIPPVLIGMGRDSSTVIAQFSGGGLSELSLKSGASSGSTSIGLSAEQVLFSLRTGYLAAVRNSPDSSVFTFYDPEFENAWKKAVRAFKSKQVDLINYDTTYDNFVVRVEGKDDAGTYYWVNLKSKHADIIETERPGIAADQIGPIREVRYTSADGLGHSGNLTLPPGASANKLPLVVIVHGPGSRSSPGFSSIAQVYASRGYAAFELNERGSGAASPELKMASAGQLGRGMQTDLAEGVAELARTGVIDPKRVCIIGYSYGGLEALLGVTTQQNVYRCAVGINSVTDLPSMLELPEENVRSAGWERAREARRLVGVERPRDPRVLAVSPLAQASKANAPVLLIHNADAKIIPPSHSRRMHSALRAAGRSSELIITKSDLAGAFGSAEREQIYSSTLKFLSQI